MEILSGCSPARQCDCLRGNAATDAVVSNSYTHARSLRLADENEYLNM